MTSSPPSPQVRTFHSQHRLAFKSGDGSSVLSWATIHEQFQVACEEVLEAVMERAKADPGIIFKGLLRGFDVMKPIIAAVNGHSYAGGTEILQATDIRIVADEARLAISEVKRSLFPMGGSTVRLVRQIPWAIAMEILLTGEPITAQEAHRIGFVNRVVPRSQVLPEALRFAGILAENGPLAVQAVKKAVLAGSGLSIEAALGKEMEIGISVSASEDAREGPRAFKEKRKAVYKGR